MMKTLCVLCVMAALACAAAGAACAPAGVDNAGNGSPANRVGAPNANTSANAGDRVGGGGNVNGVGETAAASGLELKAQFRRAGADRLLVRYEVVNRSGGAVFLLNRVPSRGAGGYSFGAGNYYLVPGEGGVVEISKRAYFLPSGSPASAPAQALPAATRLSDGQTFSEEFAVALPFSVIHPHRDVAGLPALPDPADRVRFCLGFVRDTGQNAREERAGGETLVRLAATAVQGQQVVCSEVGELGAR